MSKQKHPCVNLDIDYLDQLLYSAKLKSNTLIKDELLFRCYGRNCDPKSKEKFEDLIKYIDILDSESRKLKQGVMSCYSNDQFQCILEEIRKRIGKISNRKCVTVDECGVEDWLMRNPCCASKERWEKFAFGVCCDLRLDIEHVPLMCDFVLELVRESIPMDIILSLAICKEMREDVSLEMSRTTEEQEVDFSLLLEKHPDCDISLELFRELTIEHKVSYFLIDKALENNLTLEICRETETPALKSSFQRYYIDDISIDADFMVSNPEKFKKYIKDQDCDSLNNPQSFLHKMYSDYR